MLFSVRFQAVVLLFLLPVCLPSDVPGYLLLVLVTLLASIGLILWLLLHASLMRYEDGSVPASLNLANKLTIARFLLVPSLLVLIAGGRILAAIFVYALCSGTDILDGMAARRRKEQTQFGVVMDPLADISCTAGVFAVLLQKGLVPWWVFLVLMIRYGMLIVGTTVLFFTVGPQEFHATRVGKIVGTLQAIAVIMILGATLSGIGGVSRIGVYLFPFLGILFGSVVVSQLFLGIAHIKRRAVSVGS